MLKTDCQQVRAHVLSDVRAVGFDDEKADAPPVRLRDLRHDFSLRAFDVDLDQIDRGGDDFPEQLAPRHERHGPTVRRAVCVRTRPTWFAPAVMA